MAGPRRAQRREASLSVLLRPVLAKHRRRVVLISASSVIGGFAEAAVLVIIARVAFALVRGETEVVVGIGPIHSDVPVPELIVGAVVLVLLRLALNLVQGRQTSFMATEVLADTRKELVGSYLRAGWPLQSADREGRLQELLTTYAQAAATTTMTLSQGLVAALSLAAFLVTGLIVNPVAALAVAAAALVMGLLLRPLRHRVRKRSKRAAGANLSFATALTEVTSTAQEIRTFGVGDQVDAQLDGLTDEVAARQLHTRQLSVMVPAIHQAAGLLLLVVGLGVVYAVGVSDVPELGGVVLLMLRTLTFAQVIQSSLQTLHENAPYLEGLQEEQARYLAAGLPTGGEPVRSVGQIEFEEVAFAYRPDTPVLHDVSFAVPHGEVVGIVGPSGAGKSTLVQLLLRLREPTRGRMLIDGRDAAGLDIDQWFERVAFVPQDAHLFAGTVADNIRFHRDGVTDEAVEQAARRAHVHDELAALPQGYDTPAGERGGELSGGQRQRLCIARALIADPDLIVFDEPTSSLDGRSEALMRQTMAELAPRATVFVIAHRLSTLSICERIMVVHQGTVQHFDSPDQLERDNPFFREVLVLSGMG